jgi:hypothetical protein
MEILRRLILLSGVCAFLWLFFDSPQALLRVRAIDFAHEFNREYNPGEKPAMPGIMETGKALIRKLARPESLEQYVSRKTEGRRIDVRGNNWEIFFQEMASTTGDEAPLAGIARVWDGYACFGVNDPPMAEVLNRIRDIYAARQSNVSYLALGPRYLEVQYETSPRDLKIAGFLKYPQRQQSWWYLAAGILFYILIPWPRLRENVIAHDRLSAVLALDILGTLVVALFFTISLYAADSTAAVLGENLGLTLFLWALALGGVALLLWAARNAAFRLQVLPGILRVSGLWGAREHAFSDLSRVSYLEKEMLRSGIVITIRDGSSLKLKWDQLVYFERLLDALKAAAIPIQQAGA